MTGLELLGIVSAAAFVIAIVLRDARGREVKEQDNRLPSNVERLEQKRKQALDTMRRHKIKPITDPKRKWASSAHEATTLRKSADVVAIKGGRA
jgi:hypothetical protein